MSQPANLSQQRAVPLSAAPAQHVLSAVGAGCAVLLSPVIGLAYVVLMPLAGIGMLATLPVRRVMRGARRPE